MMVLALQGVLSSSKGEQRVIMKRVKDRVQVRPGARTTASMSAMKGLGGNWGGTGMCRAAMMGGYRWPAVNARCTGRPGSPTPAAAPPQGASEMHEMEHLITVYASRTARNSVADFLGFCENDETRNRLTRGLWLVRAPGQPARAAPQKRGRAARGCCASQPRSCGAGAVREASVSPASHSLGVSRSLSLCPPFLLVLPFLLPLLASTCRLSADCIPSCPTPPQVWAYQGNKTLAYYIKRRDCVQALAADLDVEEELAVPTVMRHIFQCLEVRLLPVVEDCQRA